jgi:anti-sigma B factor antagonist
MDCPVVLTGDIQIAAPVGDLDVAVAAQLREVLKGLITNGAFKIIIDMQSVNFIDSSCLGVFVNAHKLATAAGAAIKFAAPSEQVRKIFELTRVDKHLSFYSTMEDAITSFAGQPN